MIKMRVPTDDMRAHVAQVKKDRELLEYLRNKHRNDPDFPPGQNQLTENVKIK